MLRRVGIITPAMSSYSLSLLEGISRYAALQQTWQLRTEPPTPLGALGSLDAFEGDGLIAYADTPAAPLRQMLALPMPVVNVASSLEPLPLPSVHPDNHAVGRLAAGHFLERGFRHFAVYAHLGYGWVLARVTGFSDELERAGRQATVIERLSQNGVDSLLGLPRPLALFAVNDQTAFDTLSMCSDRDVRVPEEIAVLGVDDEATFCNLSRPPLSSIKTDIPRVGYEAAALLDRLMQGAARPNRPLLIPPKGLTTRRSTDVMAMDDVEVAAAVRFIREHGCESITVEDVAHEAGLSRSALDRRFKAALGRTPAAEIMRCRLNRVRELLTSTDWTMSRIADACGFPDGNYLAATFRRELGMTPTEYRRRR